MAAPGRRSAVKRLGLGAVLVVLILWLGGFVAFAHTLQTLAPRTPPRTDGIVVLTGDRARLVAGMKLLARGHAERLLITGVHPSTRPVDLAEALPVDEALFESRVDLGRRATNTAGNAAEAAEWAARHGYTSLTVVTAGYHMPRSLAEFRNRMPDIRLAPYPVFPAGIKMVDWWRWPGTSRILFIEYHKYLASRIRQALSPTQRQGAS